DVTGYPGIVDQDIDAPEPLERLLARSGDGCGIADVAGQSDAAVAQRLGGLLGQRRVAIPDRHLRPRLYEALGDGLAEALRATRHHGDTTCEIDLVPPLRFLPVA